MEKLRNWRKQEGLTLKRAGALIGTTGVSFGRYERRERMPTPTAMKKIFDLTDGAVTPNDWIGVETEAAAE